MKRFILVILLAFSSGILLAQEICNNGVDDDGDGLIDRNDTTDCRCSGMINGVTSLIPNPSFEDSLCCPTGYSQMQCVASWIQASDATTDYYNCGYTPPASAPDILYLPAAATPLPNNGTGYIGCFSEKNWEEFAATCLDVPLNAGANYQLHLYISKALGPQNFTLTIYGSPNCNDLPWNSAECPVGIGNWQILNAINVSFSSSTDSSWHQVSLPFTPQMDLSALAIGGPCGGQVTNPLPGTYPYSCYVYMDEFTLAAADSFNKNASITETGKRCTNDLQLHAQIDTVGGSWQWYRSGITLAGETTAFLDLASYDIDEIYTAVYTLGGNCVAIDHSVDTTDPANKIPQLLLLNPDTLVCGGAVIHIRATGTPGYHYRWWPTTGVSDPYALTPEITAGGDTTIRYVLTASYPGCPDSSTQSFLVEVDKPFGVSFRAEPEMICVGQTVYLYPQLNSTVKRLSWIFGDGTKWHGTEQESTLQHAYDNAGMMPIQLQAQFRACPDTAFTDTVRVYSLPQVILGGDTSLCMDGHAVVLRNLAEAPGEEYHYLWSTGDTAERLHVFQPGSYSLNVRSEPLGCNTTDVIVVNKGCYTDIPNVFTPNGDGMNDYFFPRQFLSKNISAFKIQIFNRWGQLIFETTHTDGRGWDGTLNGVQQPAGVYIYRIILTFNNAVTEQQDGNVTLLR